MRAMQRRRPTRPSSPPSYASRCVARPRGVCYSQRLHILFVCTLLTSVDRVVRAPSSYEHPLTFVHPLVATCLSAHVHAPSLSASLRISPQYEYNRKLNNERVFTGYLVQKTFQVKIEDIKSYPTILESLINIGLENFHGVNFSNSELDKLKLEALELAIKKSIAKAKLVCEGYGAKLGKVLTISESGGYHPPQPMHEMRTMAMSKSSGSEPSFNPGEITISNSINVTFLIE